MNLAQNLVRSADMLPEAKALVMGEQVMTYAALDLGSRHAAGLLVELGVVPGDRVAIMLPNLPVFAVLYYGALRAGAVVVPLNPLLKEREVSYALRDSGTRVIFAWNEVGAAAAAGAAIAGAEVVLVDDAAFANRLGMSSPVDGVVSRSDDDTAVILFTSGTTGEPKGAELTHGNLRRNVDIVVDELAHVTSRDVIFGGLPFFHIFGQTTGLNASVRAGACLTLLPRFDPDVALGILMHQRVTVMQGVPTMYSAMLNTTNHTRYDLSSLRMCVTGGAAMPLEVMRTFEKDFNCVVLEGYGLSETSPVASFNLADRRRAGSIGQPVRGVEFRIVDDARNDVPIGEVGEILIRGHNVMKGYWNKPEETAKAIVNGWFHTGDIGRRDEDGYYFIMDRKKEMIIRGGYNVYPREIEEVLYEHPMVAEAAVIGIPDPVWGEEIAAVVALKHGQSVTSDELREYVKSRLAAYKYPRVVHIVESLPKTPTGKIMKRDITVSS